MSYYFQPQNLLSTFGKQSNAKNSKSLSSKNSLNKNIFSNYNQQNNRFAVNNDKERKVQQKQKSNYQQLIKQRYQPKQQNQRNTKKYLCTQPQAEKISRGKKLKQNNFQQRNINLKNELCQKKMNRIQSIDKLNCRINLAIEDIAISICQSKCKSKSQLQSVKAPLKQISHLTSNNQQSRKSISIHPQNNKRHINKNFHQKSIKTEFSQSFSRKFFQNQNLNNLISRKQILRPKQNFQIYSKSINLKKNATNNNVNYPFNHIKSSFSIQDSSLKQSVLQEKSIKQSICESSFDVDLISDKLRQISNKIDSHEENMEKFKYNQTGKQNYFFQEQTEKKIMQKSLVNSRKLRLKTSQCYPRYDNQLDQSNRLKTNKKSHFFQANKNSIHQSKFQGKQNISLNRINLQQQRKSPHFQEVTKKDYSKRLKTEQESCFNKINFNQKQKYQKERQTQIKSQCQNQNHPLIIALLKQIQLDNDLRYTKHMFFGSVTLEHQNNIYQKTNSNYKWKVLSEQLQANGLDLTINQIKQIFMPKKDELDPFMSVSYSHQELVHSLIYAYQTAQIHWQKNIYQKWQYWDLRQIQLTIENIDRDRKGYINAQDLTTFINITANTQYRNRDLILIFNRFIKNRDTMPKQQINKSGEYLEKLRFKTIVDNLIKKQHKKGLYKANLNHQK